MEEFRFIRNWFQMRESSVHFPKCLKKIAVRPIKYCADLSVTYLAIRFLSRFSIITDMHSGDPAPCTNCNPFWFYE